jgi:hypothetical protein
MEKSLEIQKKKQPVALIALFLLMVGGAAIWLLIRYIYPNLNGLWKFKLNAIVIIAAVVIWAIVIVVRHANRKIPGLIIDEKGITDHTNITSVGFIPWSDITAFELVKGSFNHKLIVVKVRNPEVYIKTNAQLSASRQTQLIQFGSPILITATTLEYDPQLLVALLKERMGRER